MWWREWRERSEGFSLHFQTKARDAIRAGVRRLEAALWGSYEQRSDRRSSSAMTNKQEDTVLRLRHRVSQELLIDECGGAVYTLV